MKNIKFSRLFAAFAFVAILALAGCKQPEEETPYAIEGTWVDSTGAKFEITHSELKNTYVNNGVTCDSYAGNELTVEQTSDTSGTIFIKYTRAMNPDWTYSESAPDVGKWYAVSYKSLTDTSVEFAGAWKPNGETSCETLEDAKAEFTSDNGYYGEYTTYTRQ